MDREINETNMQSVRPPCCLDFRKMVVGGVYNAPVKFDRVDWANQSFIVLNWRGDLCNWDSPALTALWGWCAELMVRVSVGPSSPWHIKLMFHQRSSREGGMGTRLPSINDQLSWVGINQNRKGNEMDDEKIKCAI